MFYLQRNTLLLFFVPAGKLDGVSFPGMFLQGSVAILLMTAG
jgi:hypothetical protein